MGVTTSAAAEQPSLPGPVPPVPFAAPKIHAGH